MRHNLSDILQLIRDRRSVSPDAFKKRTVQRDQLNAMLEAANWAPTHGLTEPWRFKVYGGTSLRQLMEKLAAIYKAETPATSFNPLKYQKFFDRADKVSTVITVHLKRHPEKKVSEEDEVMAVACAVQNMALVAAAYGMALFWSTPKMMHHEDFQALLGIEAPDRCLGILYIGYPDLPEWPKGRRNIWMNKVEWLMD
jgi:nitroreductase